MKHFIKVKSEIVDGGEEADAGRGHEIHIERGDLKIRIAISAPETTDVGEIVSTFKVLGRRIEEGNQLGLFEKAE